MCVRMMNLCAKTDNAYSGVSGVTATTIVTITPMKQNVVCFILDCILDNNLLSLVTVSLRYKLVTLLSHRQWHVYSKRTSTEIKQSCETVVSIDQQLLLADLDLGCETITKVLPSTLLSRCYGLIGIVITPVTIASGQHT